MVNSELCASVCIASSGQAAHSILWLEQSVPRDSHNTIRPTYTSDYALLGLPFDCVNIMTSTIYDD